MKTDLQFVQSKKQVKKKIKKKTVLLTVNILQYQNSQKQFI